MTWGWALLAALAAAPQTPAKPSGGWCHVFARRCEPACKQAHEAALKGACAKQSLAFNRSFQSGAQARQLGECLVKCKKPGDAPGCVGPADEAGCDCQLKCYQKLPPSVVDAAKTAAACYDGATAACR